MTTRTHPHVSQYWAVVPAAGHGKRMHADRPKQYLPLLGRTVIEHTVGRLASYPDIVGVVVAACLDDPYWESCRFSSRVPIHRVTGGNERCQSVLNALNFLADIAHEQDWVLVHDAARPCLRHTDIARLMVAVRVGAGGMLGLPVSDTLKYCDSSNQVERTVSRDHLWRALTPQMFRLGALRRALADAAAQHILVTDEASAMERTGVHPLMVEGSADNIKITHPQDLRLAEIFLQHQKAETA